MVSRRAPHHGRESRRTLSLVNAAFIALVAMVALGSAASFVSLSELLRHSVRTAGLAREMVAGYRQLVFERAESASARDAAPDRHAEVGATSEELARRAAAMTRRSTLAMVSVAAVPLATVAAGVGLMTLVSRRIAHPLGLMLDATDRIGAGDLGHRVAYEARDEMGRLAASFNRMASCLQRSLAEIETQKATLERRVADATAELHTLSRTDELTGLPNLRHLRDAFADAAHCAEEGRTPLTLAVFGIDDFRVFNDRFGYDAGNLVVMAFARIVRAAAREVDFVARGNGVQFIVLMPGVDRVPDRLIEKAESSLTSLEKLVRQRTGADVGIGVRVGTARFVADGGSLDALLNAADRRTAAWCGRMGATAEGDASQGKELS